MFWSANSQARPGAPRLDTEEEFSLIQDRVAPSWELVFRRLRRDRLSRDISDVHPDILHLSTHCHEGGSLSLHDHSQGRIVPAPVDRFAKLVGRAIDRSLEGGLRLFVVNTCHSLELARRLAAHADATLGVEGEFPDAAAVTFSGVFYGELMNGSSLRAAVDAAIDEVAFIHDFEPQIGLFTGRGRDETELDEMVLVSAEAETEPFPSPDDDAALRRYYEPEAMASRSSEDLIWRSSEWYMDELGTPTPPLPLVCRCEHVDRSDFWPRWDLAVYLLDRRGVEFEIGAQSNRLSVDLTHATYGIYNNRGKTFLARTYLTSQQDRNKISSDAQDLHHKQLRQTSDARRWVLDDPPHVLRWASGGYLPVVQYEGEDWVMLFFRDIRPIGWNIANGASENARERLRPDLLSQREAIEELVVLTHRPTSRGEKVASLRLAFDGVDTGRAADKLLWVHDRERDHHDQFEILRGPDSKVLKVRRIMGDTEIRVVDAEHPNGVRTAGHFVTINPLGFGIEATSVGRFELPDGAYVLDGETLMDTRPGTGRLKHQLIRRPVALFAVDFLHEVICEKRQLGRLTRGERRALPPVPPEKFRIFDYDIRRRRELHDGPGDYGPESDWLHRWGEPFRRACEDGELVPELRTLCPVTWRTLELALDRIRDA